MVGGIDAVQDILYDIQLVLETDAFLKRFHEMGEMEDKMGWLGRQYKPRKCLRFSCGRC